MLLNTQSRFPSSVLILIANPYTFHADHQPNVSKGMSRFHNWFRTRGSRAVSADPVSPPTVENRMVKGALVPTFWNTCAEVMSESEWVNSKYP